MSERDARIRAPGGLFIEGRWGKIGGRKENREGERKKFSNDQIVIRRTVAVLPPTIVRRGGLDEGPR